MIPKGPTDCEPLCCHYNTWTVQMPVLHNMLWMINKVKFIDTVQFNLKFRYYSLPRSYPTIKCLNLHWLTNDYIYLWLTMTRSVTILIREEKFSHTLTELEWNLFQVHPVPRSCRALDCEVITIVIMVTLQHLDDEEIHWKTYSRPGNIHVILCGIYLHSSMAWKISALSGVVVGGGGWGWGADRVRKIWSPNLIFHAYAGKRQKLPKSLLHTGLKFTSRLSIFLRNKFPSKSKCLERSWYSWMTDLQLITTTNYLL